MIEILNKVYLVFDDGGLITSNPDGSGFKLDFKVYERILELAKRNEIVIPIACTASFFDMNRIYAQSIINPDADKILKLIDTNPDYLELWNHGLTHMYNNSYTEFDLFSNKRVDAGIQKEKLELSQKIFDSLGFHINTFVPPGHAWQQGLTDSIALDYGIKNIAIREFEKTPFKKWMLNPLKRYEKEWEASEHLHTIFRLGLGIAHDDTHFNKRLYRKTWLYLNNSFPISLFTHRKIKLKYSVNHFFAHVQNFMGDDGMEYFNYVIKNIKKQCAE